MKERIKKRSAFKGPSTVVARAALNQVAYDNIAVLGLKEEGFTPTYMTTYCELMRSPLVGSSVPYQHPEFTYEKFVVNGEFINRFGKDETKGLQLTMHVDKEVQEVLVLTTEGILAVLELLPGSNAARARSKFRHISNNPKRGIAEAQHWLMSECVVDSPWGTISNKYRIIVEV